MPDSTTTTSDDSTTHLHENPLNDESGFAGEMTQNDSIQQRVTGHLEDVVRDGFEKVLPSEKDDD